MINYRPAYPNELYHYGILGMKWGVRRYQDKNGKRTPEGKLLYAQLKSEYDAIEGKADKVADLNKRSQELVDTSNELLKDFENYHKQVKLTGKEKQNIYMSNYMMTTETSQ